MSRPLPAIGLLSLLLACGDKEAGHTGAVGDRGSDDMGDDTVDPSEAPTLTLVTPGDGDTFTTGEPVTVLVETADADESDLSVLALTWGGAAAGAGPAAPAADGTATFELGPRDAGTHSLTVQVTDPQGLSAFAAAAIEVVETDADGDGFPAGEDCDDTDPDVHPEADEICNDGVDDDCDGLTDCEDADCATECTEDCTDGRDNDLDGLTDCDDLDCSGVGTCPSILWSRARVLGGTGVFHSVERRYRFGVYGGMEHGWDWYNSAAFVGSAAIGSAWGTVQVLPAERSWATASATTCTWSASGIQASADWITSVTWGWGPTTFTRWPSFGFLSTVGHARNSVRTSGGCGLVGSGFLPSVLAPWNGEVFRRHSMTASSIPWWVVFLSGDPWYGGSTVWSNTAMGSTSFGWRNFTHTWTRTMSVEFGPGSLVHEALHR